MTLKITGTLPNMITSAPVPKALAHTYGVLPDYLIGYAVCATRRFRSIEDRQTEALLLAYLIVLRRERLIRLAG